MATKFIAVDSGKFDTKYAVWDESYLESGKLPEVRSFRTMMEPGQFNDDSLGAGTFLAKVDGKVYKLGRGASEQAELVLSKKLEIHRACILSAIALCASSSEVDEFHVAIGTPITEFRVPDKRQEYKYYTLTNDMGASMKKQMEAAKRGEAVKEPGEELFKVSIRSSNNGPVEEKQFKIISRHVYPESAGVLYIDLKKYDNTDVAVIDIGGSTAAGVQYENFDIRPNSKYFCAELGGNMLAAGLSQMLSSEFSRVDENLARKLLRNKPELRYLEPNSSNQQYVEEIRIRSKALIHEYLVNYVKEIKRYCDTKEWSLEFMKLIFIGGTSKVLKEEIREVFGENVEVAPNAELVNALGFLRRLCGTEYGRLIPVTKEQMDEYEKKKKHAA